MASSSLDLSNGMAFDDAEHSPESHQLPPDLPRTLDDRRPIQINSGLEVYDEWAGKNNAWIYNVRRRSC